MWLAQPSSYGVLPRGRGITVHSDIRGEGRAIRPGNDDIKAYREMKTDSERAIATFKTLQSSVGALSQIKGCTWRSVPCIDSESSHGDKGA